MSNAKVSADPKDKKVHIAVMGLAGSGKSTFINLASRRSDLHVGNSIASSSPVVNIAELFNFEGREISLYELPGFNNTNLSDTEVLGIIAGELEKQYRDNCKLHGIIYMHRICDIRVGVVEKSSFDIFMKVCGEKNFKNVVIVTNMWSRVPSKEEGDNKVGELATMDDFFKPVIERGAQFMHHDKETVESAHDIIRSILNNFPEALDLQTQLVDEQRPIDETSAGIQLKTKVGDIVEEYERKLAAATAEKERDAEVIQKLVKDVLKAKEDVQKAKDDAQKAKDPAPTKLKEKIHIAVMGVAGSGKSTFISLASRSKLAVGNNIVSCTSVDAATSFELDGREIILFETPGFNDRNLSETEILKIVAGELEMQYRKDKKLHGIIYLHRITDIVGNLEKVDFSIFMKLCGENSLKNVVIVTNMWGRVRSKEEGEGKVRRLETMDDFFKAAIEKGARFMNHSKEGVESAHRIIRSILGNNRPVALDIQTQLVDENKPIDQTSAGIEVSKKIVAKCERKLADQNEALQQAQGERDEETRRELLEEAERAKAAIVKLEAEMKDQATEYDRFRRQLEEAERQSDNGKQRSTS